MRHTLIAGFIVLSAIAALDLFGPGAGLLGDVARRPFVSVDLVLGDAFPPDYVSEPARAEAGVAAGERVAVDGSFGILSVSEASTGEAAVTYTVEVWGRGNVDAFARGVQVRWESGAGGPRLVVDRPEELPRGIRGYRINASLVVPQGTSVTIEHRGDVTVEGLSGELELTHGGGRAEVRGGNGPVSAKSQYGSLSVTGVAGAVSVDFSSGELIVRDVAGPVRGSFRYGEATIASVKGDVALDVAQGAATVERIGGDLRLTARYGSFDVADVSGFVDLDLGMGDASVDDLAGGARLKVQAANLDVRLAPGGGWSVNGVVEMGELRSAHGLDRYEEGRRAEVSGVIGDGRFPLAIDVRQGSVNLR